MYEIQKLFSMYHLFSQVNQAMFTPFGSVLPVWFNFRQYLLVLILFRFHMFFQIVLLCLGIFMFIVYLDLAVFPAIVSAVII